MRAMKSGLMPSGSRAAMIRSGVTRTKANIPSSFAIHRSSSDRNRCKMVSLSLDVWKALSPRIARKSAWL